jgi:hypothetical protein
MPRGWAVGRWQGTEEVNVALVCGGKFKELAGEVLVDGSLLHDGKLLGNFQYDTLVERHFTGKSKRAPVRQKVGGQAS